VGAVRALRKQLGLPPDARGDYSLERLIAPGGCGGGRCGGRGPHKGCPTSVQRLPAAVPGTWHQSSCSGALTLRTLRRAVGVTASELAAFVEQCTRRYERKRIDPGSTVGAFGAQSIGGLAGQGAARG
jgi:hypothetical protein